VGRKGEMVSNAHPTPLYVVSMKTEYRGSGEIEKVWTKYFLSREKAIAYIGIEPGEHDQNFFMSAWYESNLAPLYGDHGDTHCRDIYSISELATSDHELERERVAQ
jgi:hypothetical protein